MSSKFKVRTRLALSQFYLTKPENHVIQLIESLSHCQLSWIFQRLVILRVAESTAESFFYITD